MKTSLIIRRLSLAAAVIAFAALAAGCASCKPGKPGPIGKYDIQVNLDQSLRNASMLVDLVGVNASSLPRWEAYSMNKYWEDNDAMRTYADKITLSFVSGESLARTMEAKNPKWEQWRAKGVTHVVVLAHLPGAHADKPGTQDPRRQILPLDQCTWPKKTKALSVVVKRSGIEISTPLRTAQ